MQNQATEKIEKPRLQVRDCGLADYREILKLQLHLCRERQQGKIPNTVLIVEHPAVITLGARQSLNKLLIARKELENNNIDVVDIRRGGGTTAHNPGQLVCYPIFNLRELGLGISEYIRALEATGAELLEQLGIELVPFGPKTMAVQAFPTMLAKADPLDFIQDLIDLLERTASEPDEERLLDEVLNMAACKAAIKAGQRLTDSEIEQLLTDKGKTQSASHCPHGRPTTITFSISDLEKQFKRT